MKKLLSKILFLFVLANCFTQTEKAKALVPYYYFPQVKNLKKESLSIGQNAYQLLYFGQIKESLNLAKLAIKINKSDEKLWMILSDTQLANGLYNDALISLKKAEKINSTISEIHFAKSNIYLKQSDKENAKIALKTGLKIEPDNYRAIFQLGNIYLMQNKYSSSINFFEKVTKINPDFWQAINNVGLAYFEQNKINKSINSFEKAILINENAEPLLGLASCLSKRDINTALVLAKKALKKNPKYVEYDYRKEQLWGEKLQKATEILFQNEELLDDIKIAKSKINK